MQIYDNYVFDLYGTLVDIETDELSATLWKRMAGIYSGFGADYQWKKLRDRFFELDSELRRKKSEQMKTEYPEVDIAEVFTELLLNPDKSHDTDSPIYDVGTWVNTIAYTFRVLSRKHIALYPDTISTLMTLRDRGCKLYLLSNAQRLYTMPEIEMMGIGAFFDDILISSDFGVIKPDGRFLRDLMYKHKMEPSETVMVGNDFTSDMGVARECGVDGVLINTFPYRGKELDRIKPSVAAVIKTLNELVEIRG